MVEFSQNNTTASPQTIPLDELLVVIQLMMGSKKNQSSWDLLSCSESLNFLTETLLASQQQSETDGTAWCLAPSWNVHQVKVGRPLVTWNQCLSILCSYRSCESLTIWTMSCRHLTFLVFCLINPKQASGENLVRPTTIKESNRSAQTNHHSPAWILF